MMPPRTLIIAAICAAGVTLVSVILWRRSDPSPAVNGGPIAPAGDAAAASWNLRATDANLPDAIQTVANDLIAASPQLRSLPADARGAFGVEASASISAALSGSARRSIERVKGTGGTVPPALEAPENQADAEELYHHNARSIRDAEFMLASADIIPWAVGGRAGSGPSSNLRAHVWAPEDRYPSLRSVYRLVDAMPERAGTLIELTIPTLAADREGARHEVRIGFVFALSPTPSGASGARWLHVGTCVYHDAQLGGITPPLP